MWQIYLNRGTKEGETWADLFYVARFALQCPARHTRAAVPRNAHLPCPEAAAGCDRLAQVSGKTGGRFPHDPASSGCSSCSKDGSCLRFLSPSVLWSSEGKGGEWYAYPFAQTSHQPPALPSLPRPAVRRSWPVHCENLVFGRLLSTWGRKK